MREREQRKGEGAPNYSHSTTRLLYSVPLTHLVSTSSSWRFINLSKPPASCLSSPAALLPCLLRFLKRHTAMRVTMCPKTTRVGSMGPGGLAGIWTEISWEQALAAATGGRPCGERGAGQRGCGGRDFNKRTCSSTPLESPLCFLHP